MVVEKKFRESPLKFEKNFIRKKWTGRIPIALIFPNKYEIGMANLGFLYLYERLNSYDELVCERFFYDGEVKIRSIENNRPLKDFPLLLFTIPFEGDFVNVVNILIKSEIKLNPLERRETVLAGGIATWSNPFPLSSFMDGFLLGEWEAMEKELIPLILEYSSHKEKLIEKLSELEYFFSPLMDLQKRSLKIIKKIFPENPILSKLTSERAQFKESYLLEVSKGCGRACRFCLAGFISRPPRGYSSEALLKKLEEIPPKSKVGLIGLEFANRDEVLRLGKELLKKEIILTFSSLRLDTIKEDFFSLLISTKSIALAPETASERLKRVINKEISNELIFEVLERLKGSSVKKIKFYFMFGLPTEKESDLMESIKFIKELKKRKAPFKFIFSFSPFVPKPHTPFQWADFDFALLKEKKNLINKELSSIPEVKVESLKDALLQAILARGDKNLKDFILALALGEPLNRAKERIENLESILKPPKDIKYVFPWEQIKCEVKKEFLYNEWIRAHQEKVTSFCQPKVCKACGACKIL
ncbi:MAG: radical SAM protein [Caldimicrobium sp.]